MNDLHGRTSATRERLLAVSAKLFARHGFDGVSVRRMVRAAKVNLGAVTYHFGGKEELFAEVMARETRELRALGQSIVTSRKAPDAKLRDMLRIYALRVMHENPDLKMLFTETIAGGARIPRAMIESLEWRNRVFTDVVREGVRKGLFRKCDVECLCWNFFEMLSSYILCQRLMERMKGVVRTGKDGAYSKAYVTRVVNTALDVFMNGLLKPAGRRARRGVRR